MPRRMPGSSSDALAITGAEMAVSTDSTEQHMFTLAEAQQLLPRIRALTVAAMQEADQLLTAIQRMEKTEPARATAVAELEDVVAAWTGQVQTLGPKVKGLWLVDFDNGDGYYCWKYPEVTILHYHGYDEGFSERMKIV